MEEKLSWQDFCAKYYEQAMKNAKYHLDKYKASAPYWDKRIDEESIKIDAAVIALEKTYEKYDPTKGAGYKVLLGNIVGHEVVNELRRVPKLVTSMHELSASQEKEATFRNIASLIPKDNMINLKERLHDAILKLSPIDQCILGFYINNPKTFIEESVEALHIPANVISVRKSRALMKLPSLMGVSRSDYLDMHEDCPTLIFGMMQNQETKTIIVNPVYPQFDLANTVDKTYEAIRAAKD